MKARRYLTKSTFKIGLECPRKLFYLNKPEEYLNEKLEDPFLEALARGGYQVGALAHTKFSGGIEIKSKNHDEALEETKKHLESQNVVLFEAAFDAADGAAKYFVRSDIVLKAGKKLRIIEVKSKSFDDDDEADTDQFTNSRVARSGGLKLLSKWSPYIYDLAFQVFVARLAHTELEVSASLMLLDKSSKNPQEGLHQMFLVKSNAEGGFEVVLTSKLSEKFLGHMILKEVDLTELVDGIIEGKEQTEHWIMGPIAQKAAAIADIYLGNKRTAVSNLVGTRCKGCEFRGQSESLRSGFDECWVEEANIKAASNKQLAIDLWNFRSSQNAIDSKKFRLSDLTEDEIGDGTRAFRQLLIIEKHRNNDQTPWFDLDYLRSEMSKWKFPFHFIDFETCMPALPFKKDFPPYSEIAFQFSHHIMHRDGKIEHVGEFIDLTPGKFVTFDFMRELYRQLNGDEGTIFRYSAHENSVLNRAIGLIEKSDEPDREELVTFFKTVTTKRDPNNRRVNLWSGSRNMVDLLEVLKQGYYSPKMGNSNSIKYVLPAVIMESAFLRDKYSKPVYGTEEIPSKNFKNHQWIKFDGLQYSADPYQELPPLFTEQELKQIEGVLSDEESINNGGAAMMAYCKSQFTEMSDLERESIRRSLLKYCELDTLAMVMIVEYWRSKILSLDS